MISPAQVSFLSASNFCAFKLYPIYSGKFLHGEFLYRRLAGFLMELKFAIFRA